MERKQEASETVGLEEPGLVSLAPSYDETVHGAYVDALVLAMKDQTIRNVALSGSYGVGKSSILNEFASRHPAAVVELSLSTLNPHHDPVVGDELPRQAGTTTNRIQQEIVKQLLYGVRPEKMAGSRFRRIERFRWRREIPIAILVGAAVALAFLLTTWTRAVAIELGYAHLAAWKIHAVGFFSAASCALLVQWLAHGRVHVKQLSAGSATVTLDEKSVSYFDQYLDEIVHFFQATKRTIVIFEDIDRFEDPYIFETLRSLNSLLNSAPDLARPVRFVYALRDSIFETNSMVAMESSPPALPEERGDAQADGAPQHKSTNGSGVRDPGANRTKFFDLIIPVVPFITHASARDLATQLMAGFIHKIDQDLIDLAVRFVPDMRILKNVRNEFIVFRRSIFSGKGKELQITQTGLFAMMLYKSTYLSDFERIRTADSSLDDIYRFYRELVSRRIESVESQLARMETTAVKKEELGARAQRYGDLLANLLSKHARVAGFNNIETGTYSVDEEAYSDAQLRQEEFWGKLAQSRSAGILWNHPAGETLQLSRSDIVSEIGEIDPVEWSREAVASRDQRTSELLSDIRFLRGASISDLMKGPSSAKRRPAHVGAAMVAKVQRVFGPGLAFELIKAGFVDRNFTLYTSTFYGHRSSPAATNFLIHNVNQLIPDAHFLLRADDVDTVLKERGSLSLQDPTFYNVNIFDHALSADGKGEVADQFADSVAKLGDVQRKFVQVYCSGGAHAERLIRLVSKRNSLALNFVAIEAEISSDQRLQLASAALSTLGDTPAPQYDQELADYLTRNFQELSFLIDQNLQKPVLSHFVQLLRTQGIRVPHLSAVSTAVLTLIIDNNLFEINSQNIEFICKDAKSLSLNSVKAVNGWNYTYFIRNMDKYLPSIAGRSFSVDDPAELNDVLADLVRTRSTLLGEMLLASSPECIVSELSAVPVLAWQVLAQQARFQPTFRNVKSYMGDRSSIDPALAAIISTDKYIVEVDSASQEARVQLAYSIIAASDSIPNPAVRAAIASSLDLEEYLDVNEIPAENGPLMAQLVGHVLINDEPEAYSRLRLADWSAREALIVSSDEFVSYMTPDLVRGDVARILSSEAIPSNTKARLLGDAASYAAVSTDDEISVMARYAIRVKSVLPPELIERFSRSKPSREELLSLVMPQLGALSGPQFVAMVKLLPGDYSKLTKPGYGSARVPQTSDDELLLMRLKREGIVNSYRVKKGRFEVFKRQK